MVKLRNILASIVFVTTLSTAPLYADGNGGVSSGSSEPATEYQIKHQGELTMEEIKKQGRDRLLYNAAAFLLGFAGGAYFMYKIKEEKSKQIIR